MDDFQKILEKLFAMDISHIPSLYVCDELPTKFSRDFRTESALNNRRGECDTAIQRENGHERMGERQTDREIIAVALHDEGRRGYILNFLVSALFSHEFL
jgi:hypothetical protein